MGRLAQYTVDYLALVYATWFLAKDFNCEHRVGGYLVLTAWQCSPTIPDICHNAQVLPIRSFTSAYPTLSRTSTLRPLFRFLTMWLQHEHVLSFVQSDGHGHISSSMKRWICVVVENTWISVKTYSKLTH